MSPSYLLKSQLSEKQIEADVSFYLGWCSNEMPFRLLDIDEQETGADKLSTVTVPIYIQFKKSQGLQPLPPQQLKRRVVEDKMQSVRRFRRDNMLSDDPTLFFGLRAMAEHASDFQHNILLDHHRPESSHAIYVAPLHLDKERYFVDLLTGKRHLDDPWIWKRAELLSDVGHRAWLSRYELPALPEAPDEVIEIAPAISKPRQPRAPEDRPATKAKVLKKARRLEYHPLLFGVEGHLRKSREVKDGEFVRPYKRILPDLISSEAALPRALSVANALYLALDKQGYRVHIAPQSDDIRRIRVVEQEVELKDRKYGRYYSGGVWGPDRPTIFYIDSVPIGLALTEMTERVTMRYLNGDYHREDSRLVRSMKSWQLTHSRHCMVSWVWLLTVDNDWLSEVKRSTS